MTAPTLTGLAPSITFAENTVNATPQVIDSDVTFSDAEGNFNGGALTVSGLLAEDRVSILSGAVISLVAGVVYYDADGVGGAAAVAIGTASGGVGATFTVTFNASATSAAIDALIQNLTYANVSDTPTASRTLVLGVVDGNGEILPGSGSGFAQQDGSNPFAGMTFGIRAAATFGDLDGDGDLDAIVGVPYDGLQYFENTGTSQAGVFERRTGTDVPFSGTSGDRTPSPVLVDVDADGDLDLVFGTDSGFVRYQENTGTAGAAAFTERTGAANPFADVYESGRSTPTFGDLDDDGDLDFVVGGISGGALHYFENTGSAAAPAFVQRTGTANPFNGLAPGDHSSPSLVDVDGDGDLDVAVGEINGTITFLENTGSAAVPSYVVRTGAASPFDGMDVGEHSLPTFADLDGDGDLDAFVGNYRVYGGADAEVRFFANQPSITVKVTAQNDALTASGLPTDVTVTEDVASNLDLSGLTLADLDGDTLTVVLTASAGIMMATGGAGVTVSNRGSGAITLTGTASAIDTFLNSSAIQYIGAPNANGDNAATVTVTANDGSGVVQLGVVNIDITANSPMSLTGFASSITVDENTVNATPQRLDIDVSFSDPDSFDGGRLTLSGLLAEDRVSVRNEGTGAGQIGLSGADVTFGGVVIGTLAGGVGGTLTITFNAAATDVAVDALIQNLTYANVSNTPTASRNLLLDIVDGGGESLVGAGSVLTRQDGANPFAGIDVLTDSHPTFGDLDGDGDLDLMVGLQGVYNGYGFEPGRTIYFENTGTASAPVLTDRGSIFDAFIESRSDLVDLDGDGDLDVVVGDYLGRLHLITNTGTASAPSFSDNGGPFGDIRVSHVASPAFADLDGDGDLDLAVGRHSNGALQYFENTGTASSPSFTERTDEANPFAALDVGMRATPTFVDFDGDGDQDVFVGSNDGDVRYLENTGTASAPLFVARTGADNPFNGIDVGDRATVAVIDVDGDGDLDAVMGKFDGELIFLQRGSPRGQSLTVNVTAQNDAPTQTGLPTDLTVIEDVASSLDLRSITLSDADGPNPLSLVLTASAGTMTATSGGGVTVTNSGAGVLTLTGTASAIDTFLNTASAVRYTGALNVYGDNAATVTLAANDGSGAVTLGVVTLDITASNDRMSISGLAPSVTFGENTVNAAPQRLDIDVSFADPDSFTGGALVLSGLLAEDRVSVRNEGAGAGQIGLSGTDVTFGGVVIGTLAGGSGTTLTITFNAAATGVAVDALIQNLTYANVSDTPTANRDLVLNVTDVYGEDLTTTAFTRQTGSGNPFAAVTSNLSAPSLADLDGDGDLDAVVGDRSGVLRYLENTGTSLMPTMVERTGGANPFNGFDVGDFSSPAFVDLDNDGDLDLVSGLLTDVLQYFENTGTLTTPVFVARTGTANPFNDIHSYGFGAPALADLDNDGDQDIIVGNVIGTYTYLENTGSASIPRFVMHLSGAQNPLNGIDTGFYSGAMLFDRDGDGDQDFVAGNYDGTLFYFENTGNMFAPVFIRRFGSANPFDGQTLDLRNMPTAADIDGDGDLDIVVGQRDANVVYFQATRTSLATITVNVTAEDEPILGGATADSLVGTAGSDTVDGGDGDDVIDGGAGDDILIGGAGGDYLRGGEGADAMTGGTGNDTYVIDNAGDTTDETGGDGIDLVHSRFSWTLGSGLENLTLGNGGAWSGTGNTGANVITGNSLANVISGLAGNDTLNGGGGNDILNGGDDDDTLNGETQNDTLNGGAGSDTLNGGAHNDALDGGTGADTMIGGTGHDSYVVDDAGDVVTEDAGIGTGTDTVSASISYSLTANVENLTLTGSGDLNGTGNGLANTLTGNSGTNILHGGDGADVLNGLEGNDALNGEVGNDTLDGGADNDVLTGGAGQDRLTGGAGADAFVFINADMRRTGPGFGLAADKDVILDLSFAGGDRIDLSAIDANAILAGDQAFTFVSNFTGVAGQATLKFISGKSVLQLDVDGDSKADLLVEINGNITGTTTNLYTGGGDVNGGWVL